MGQGCHLCERALEVVEEARDELGFALDVVDITDRPELESSYRASIPVVEIDGALAFRFHVPPAALRTRLA